MKIIPGENGSNRRTRRRVLFGLAGAAALGLAGCLGNGGDGTTPDSNPTDDDGPSPTTTTQSAGDGTAPVDLRMFPPDHNKESFTAFSITYDSIVLTTTGGTEVTVPVDRTASLISGSTATGVPVAKNLAVPAGEYETVDVHYSIDSAVTTDGRTAEIEFTSPGSVDVLALTDKPSTIEESDPYVLQTHFGLVSEPWSLFMSTIILGPGIPD
jgi:hypothetical protein